MPQSEGVYAILAHDDPAGLATYVRDLRQMVPGARVVLFNGGADASLAAGLDVDVVPDSIPLRYGRLAEFHLRTLRHIQSLEEPYRFVVTLEPDVAVVRPGLDQMLVQAMEVQHADYLAAGYWVRDRAGLPIGMSYQHWQEVWRPLLGTDMPSGCYNPAQVFGRPFVDRLLALPQLAEIEALLPLTPVHAMEEVVWPTLAAATGGNPGWPGTYSEAVRLVRFRPSELQRLVDGGTHLVHKVGTSPGDPDRQIVNELMAGRTPDYDSYPDTYVPSTGWRRVVPTWISARRIATARQREL